MNFNDFFLNYGEAQVANKYGPDWRQKLAQMSAELEQTQASTARTRAATRTEEVQQGQIQEQIELAKQRRAEIAKLVARGELPTTELDIADYLLKKKLNESNIRENESQIGMNEAHRDLYRRMPGTGQGGPFSGARWINRGDGSTALLTKSGQIVSDIGGEAIGQPPTADQRNMERYDIVIPTQLQQVRQALKRVKEEGSGAGSYLHPRGYQVRALYTRLVEGLAATAARAMGDNKISDSDRRAYASLYGVASQLVGVEPVGDLAEQLLDQATQLAMANAQARRQAQIPGRPTDAPVVPGDPAKPDVGDTLDRIFGRRKQ